MFFVNVAAILAGTSEKTIARSRRIDFTPVCAPQALMPLTLVIFRIICSMVVLV